MLDELTSTDIERMKKLPTRESQLLAEPVLGHRLIISPAARIRNVTAPTVMNDILTAVPVPGARAGRRFERDSAVTR